MERLELHEDDLIPRSKSDRVMLLQIYLLEQINNKLDLLIPHPESTLDIVDKPKEFKTEVKEVKPKPKSRTKK